MRVRLVQAGWNVNSPATSKDDLRAGVQLLRVEFVNADGGVFVVEPVFDAYVRLRSDGVADTRVMLDLGLLAAADIVYLDDNGNEIDIRPLPEAEQAFDHDSHNPIEGEAP